MSDTEKRLRVVLDGDASGFQKQFKGAKGSTDALGRSLDGVAGQVRKALDKLNATEASRSMNILEKAVDKVGGVAKLSAQQVITLRKEIDRLAAAGATVPKNLVLPKVPTGDAFGKGIKGGIESAAQNLGGGNLITQALSSVGPAGLAAAAGIGATTAALVAGEKVIAAYVERAGTLTDLSQQTGLGTDFLQDLDFVGSQVGVTLEAAAASAGHFNKVVGAALSGDKAAIAAFDQLGISVEQLLDLKPEERYALAARALSQYTDAAVFADKGNAVFGKGVAEVANLLKSDLVTGFEQAKQSSTRLSEAAIKTGDDLGDAFTRLGKTADALKFQLGAALLGSLGGGDAAKGVDTVTNALRGMLGIVKDPAFQQFLNALTLGVLSKGVKALADKGQFEGLTVLSDKQIADKNAPTGPDLFTELSGNEELVAKAKEASEAHKQALAEAEAYAKELERIAEEEKRAAVESNKRWAAEQTAVEKVNEAVRKRLSDAQTSVFGTSKDAALEAEFQFGILQRAVESAGQSITTMSESDLGAYEAQLMKIERATRADAAANEEVRRTLRAVQAEIDKRDNAPGFAQAGPKLDDVKKKTVEWGQELANISHLIQSFPGGLGKVGGALSGLTAAGAGIGGGLKAFKDASALGGLTGILGKVGAAGQIASAAIGIGQVIVGLFKSDPVKKAQQEAGRALGYGISRELAQTLLDQAKATGKSITEVAKQYAGKVKAEQDKANLDTLRAGVDIAKGGAQDLLGLLDKLSPKAQAAGNALVQAVADAMAANGLGVLATGTLADQSTEEGKSFAAVQAGVAAAGQIFQGQQQAGGITEDLLSNGGAFADALREQAVEAALVAGKTQEEANKIGIATVAPLLRDQLEASIQSGEKLSAQTQALLDEAKANGIDIIADPTIAILAESKEQTALLRQIAGGSGGSKSEGDFQGRFRAAAGLGPLFTGSGSPRLDLQLDPHEAAFVVPRADTMDQVTARLVGSGAGVSGGGSGGVSISQPVSVSVSLSGGATQADADRVADAVLAAVRRGHHPLNAELDKRIDRRVR